MKLKPYVSQMTMYIRFSKKYGCCYDAIDMQSVSFLNKDGQVSINELKLRIINVFIIMLW